MLPNDLFLFNYKVEGERSQREISKLQSQNWGGLGYFQAYNVLLSKRLVDLLGAYWTEPL